MARRSNSIIEELVELTAKLPWWIGLFFAVISYLVLHWYAGRELPEVASDINGLVQSVLPTFLRTFAFFGQYLAPVLFLLGSLLSAIKRHKRKKLYDKTSWSASLQSFENLTWRDFEYVVCEYFHRRKFSTETTKSGADGGVDIIAKKGSEKYLIQCKHWKTSKVGVKVIRELLGVVAGSAATGGIVVTSSKFTQDAIDFARSNKIILLDGKELHNNMKSDTLSDVQTNGKSLSKRQKVKWVSIGFLLAGICFFAMQHLLQEPQVGKQNDLKFTDEQIRNAMEEVVEEKKGEQAENEKEKPQYRYEIELFTGGMIYTDNAEILKSVVKYKSSNGLTISINRDEIKTMKKVRADKK